jgi:hypothetical protein
MERLAVSDPFGHMGLNIRVSRIGGVESNAL